MKKGLWGPNLGESPEVEALKAGDRLEFPIFREGPPESAVIEHVGAQYVRIIPAKRRPGPQSRWSGKAIAARLVAEYKRKAPEHGA